MLVELVVLMAVHSEHYLVDMMVVQLDSKKVDLLADNTAERTVDQMAYMWVVQRVEVMVVQKVEYLADRQDDLMDSLTVELQV